MVKALITHKEYTSQHQYISFGLANVVEESYFDVKSEYKAFLYQFERPAVLAAPVRQGNLQQEQLNFLVL